MSNNSSDSDNDRIENIRRTIEVIGVILAIIFSIRACDVADKANDISNDANVYSREANNLSKTTFSFDKLEAYKSEAPLLFAERNRFIGGGANKYKMASELMEYYDESKNKINERSFTLDSRIFELMTNREIGESTISETKLVGPYNSLILDTRPNVRDNSDDDKNDWFCYGIIYLRNIGFDLVSLEIKGIKVYFKEEYGGDMIELKPNLHSKLYYYMANGETIKLYISEISYVDDHPLTEPKKRKNSEVASEKLAYVGDNVFNSVIPVSMETYYRMEFDIEVVNKYNEIYNQTIIMGTEDATYSTNSELILPDEYKME